MNNQEYSSKINNENEIFSIIHLSKVIPIRMQQKTGSHLHSVRYDLEFRPIEVESVLQMKRQCEHIVFVFTVTLLKLRKIFHLNSSQVMS